MGRVNPNRLGLVLAVMMAAWHGLWLVLVATGVDPLARQIAGAMCSC